jgi:hypothetical protein
MVLNLRFQYRISNLARAFKCRYFCIACFGALTRPGRSPVICSSHKNTLFQQRAPLVDNNSNMNDNQNYFVQSGKTTSRVLAQPGGQCSIMLGGWTPEELEKQRKATEQKETAEVVKQRE